MSETVHYRGVAKKLMLDNDEETYLDFAKRELEVRNKPKKDYYSDEIEQLCGDYGEEFFFYKNVLYLLDYEELEQDEEIIKASIIDDNTINFELRFYNGGAGFDECLEEAFNEIL